MSGPRPPKIQIVKEERVELEHLVNKHSTPQQVALRARIILLSDEGLNNTQIARQLKIDRDTVRRWRKRWIDSVESELSVEQRLKDAERPGAPFTFNAEQVCQLIAIACEDPAASGRPISHWTPYELADEMIKRDIVESISPRHVGRLLAEGDLKPHQLRYWKMLRPDERFDEKIKDISGLYISAPELAKKGERVLSTDEKTGIQALQRKYPSLPMIPGKVEYQDTNYIRHGTQTLIANFDVPTGQIIAPSLGDTRTEEDFVAHIQKTVATDPTAKKWHFVTDNLNIHQSESLVRFVTDYERLDIDLGVKDKSGILKSMKTRATFLSEPSRKIMFHYTPKGASWMNQIELWFSILVRRLLKRASFESVADLKARILAFIDYFNRTMAKPFKWTYKGKVLAA